ncbi:hypothetical protein VTK56DRAFT_1990 [Thermocarpiscus australiensis]
MQLARRSCMARRSNRHAASIAPANLVWRFAARPFTSSQPCLKAKQESLNTPQSRFSKTTTRSSDDESGPHAGPDPARAIAAAGRITKAFLAHQGIPSEEATLAALRACAQIDVRPGLGAEERRSEDVVAEARPASQLLDLDATAATAADTAVSHTSTPPRAQSVVDKISDAAYAIVTHPTVVITKKVLEEYVRLQARLGRPQTLPQVLALYASKPRPKPASGSIRYIERNPNKAGSAVDPAVADMALDAAIEAKDLQAAIGVLENTYAAKAFLRSKIINKALVPGFVAAVTPLALYYIATELAQLQYSLEPTVATNMAYVGILCYVGFTATIGMVAAFTSNDHMKRVTWAIGTPLRQRWLHEEERAALDKIACSFGYSEEHRYGEEEGEEFAWLREYMLRKSMILDAVDLMPGMN